MDDAIEPLILVSDGRNESLDLLEITKIHLDILVLGDDRQATDLVQALAARIPGFRGIYAGRLRNCRQIEAFTANLVSINRRYKSHAGLRITHL